MTPRSWWWSSCNNIQYGEKKETTNTCNNDRRTKAGALSSDGLRDTRTKFNQVQQPESAPPNLSRRLVANVAAVVVVVSRFVSSTAVCVSVEEIFAAAAASAATGEDV